MILTMARESRAGGNRRLGGLSRLLGKFFPAARGVKNPGRVTPLSVIEVGALASTRVVTRQSAVPEGGGAFFI
jgi:hypothetical protein